MGDQTGREGCKDAGCTETGSDLSQVQYKRRMCAWQLARLKLPRKHALPATRALLRQQPTYGLPGVQLAHTCAQRGVVDVAWWPGDVPLPHTVVHRIHRLDEGLRQHGQRTDSAG